MQWIITISTMGQELMMKPANISVEDVDEHPRPGCKEEKEN
jgi:hypothetical protein